MKKTGVRYKRHTVRRKRGFQWYHALIIAAIAAVGFYFVTQYGVRILSFFRSPQIVGSVAIPQNYELYGIDVSNHQGSIQWDEVNLGVDAGHCASCIEEDCTQIYPITFAFIKATEGADFIDKRYKTNIEGARQVGIAAGSYHYFKPNRGAKRQAQHFMKNASFKSGDLPPVLDLEETGHLSTTQLCDSALVWLRYVEKQVGTKPIIYANPNFLKRLLKDKRLRPYHIWVAHYQDGESPAQNRWHFWQFTDRGVAFGINTTVDINVFVSNNTQFDSMLLP